MAGNQTEPTRQLEPVKQHTLAWASGKLQSRRKSREDPEELYCLSAYSNIAKISFCGEILDVFENEGDPFLYFTISRVGNRLAAFCKSGQIRIIDIDEKTEVRA